MSTRRIMRSCPKMSNQRMIKFDSNAPFLLDLFCGCGGAGMGYYRAGFNVIGVDIALQPNYPFDFVQFDALALDYDFLLQFDAIHASPPCQAYSRASVSHRKRGKIYPDLYNATLRMLAATGKLFIIENVLGSPAKGARLNGLQFGLRVLRERIFETNFHVVVPTKAPTMSVVERLGLESVYGSHHSTRWRAAMGITWAEPHEIKEAIPPAYTTYLGFQLLDRLEALPSLI